MSHRLLTATYLIVIFLHFRGGIIITGLLLLCALAAIMVLWSVLYVLRLVRRRPE